MAVLRGIGGAKKVGGGFYTVRLVGTIVDVRHEFKQASDTAVMMANEGAAKMFVNYVDHIIPRKTGNLARSVSVKMNSSLSMSVQYKADYAWWQERGYTSGLVKRYTTPGTTAGYARKGREYVEKSFDEYVRKYGKELTNRLPILDRR